MKIIQKLKELSSILVYNVLAKYYELNKRKDESEVDKLWVDYQKSQRPYWK